MTDEVIAASAAVVAAIEALVRAELASGDAGRFARIQRIAEITEKLRRLYVAKVADLDSDLNADADAVGEATRGVVLVGARRPITEADLLREVLPAITTQVRTSQVAELRQLCELRDGAAPGADTASISSRMAELERELGFQLPRRTAPLLAPPRDFLPESIAQRGAVATPTEEQ